ncbi:uncharacterized protein LOC113276155 [Papaver somniferum]|uniref:uncharacterized protein LOC113276155 n=1 Tax=Papaver somniferum TaxID=3469 RepID=UPI000E7008C6|nr:uncharacterized protein LOC113276155 [Papaver somniferum]
MDIPIEYQWKPSKCTSCLVFGPSNKECTRKRKARWTPKKVIKGKDDGEQNSERIVESMKLVCNSVNNNFKVDEILLIESVIGEKGKRTVSGADLKSTAAKDSSGVELSAPDKGTNVKCCFEKKSKVTSAGFKKLEVVAKASVSHSSKSLGKQGNGNGNCKRSYDATMQKVKCSASASATKSPGKAPSEPAVVQKVEKECEDDSDGFSDIKPDKDTHYMAIEEKASKRTEKKLLKLPMEWKSS